MMLAKIIPAALANHLWQSTLFAVAAALLAFALRRNRAQTRYWLWLIASLKFLLPFSLLVSIGSYFKWPASVPIAHPAFSAAVQQIGQRFAVPEVFSGFSQPPVTTAASPLPAILFSIWFCGVVAVLFFWWRRWMHVRAAVRAASPLPLETGIPALSSPSLLEPGVFGIFRPVLLLPAGITAHLAPAHIEAILAHELCHVRRRDNLAAAIHMLVEAVFWFHPLVWWIGARMVEERERACDEEVLRLGNQPQVYAESILKTCQFYLESPLACLSGITGSDLKKRMVRIMTQHIAVRLDFRKKLLLTAAAIAVIALPLATGVTNASQSAGTAPPLSFEVASIKPSKSGSPGMMLRIQPGGRFTASGIPMKFLLEQAYGIKDSQISQAPPWFDSEHWDIDAKPEDSVGAEMDKLPPEQRKDKLMQMLQSLLVERCKLSLGHETKELPIYALVVAKNGPKLHASTFKPPDKLTSLPPPSPMGKGDRPMRGGGEGIMMNGRGNLTSTGVELSMLVNVLSRITGRIVVDKTGLTGRYDFTLQWTPDESQGPIFPGGGPGPGMQVRDGAPPPESSGPSLFTAIQEELGLKLESQKAPVQIFVIEHVERPSEN